MNTLQMIERKLTEDDFEVITEWLEQSPEWLSEEGLLKKEMDLQRTKVWMSLYDKYDGNWLMWEENHSLKGISFHIINAPSNNKPWIGMIMVNPEYRGNGYGSSIVHHLCKRLELKGYNIVFTACPFQRVGWLRFLATCGFEQIGTETTSTDKRYIKLAKPL
ncbi:GNAT family N-acetyltransferase [Bacillus sp. Marseille-Q3570]|uniref:GNAT family N-acetyltransferase n=1 Tax=Bacillus sp. Marseille-Q3570 TaxID=2963522 RepID=UPI0021B843EA|nr:GNAT family N-acetyltransferase [Bacillus sp. Marseille-Q3570]